MTKEEYEKDLRELKLNFQLLNDPEYRIICELSGKILADAYKELIS